MNPSRDNISLTISSVYALSFFFTVLLPSFLKRSLLFFRSSSYLISPHFSFSLLVVKNRPYLSHVCLPLWFPLPLLPSLIFLIPFATVSRAAIACAPNFILSYSTVHVIFPCHYSLSSSFSLSPYLPSFFSWLFCCYKFYVWISFFAVLILAF